MSSFRVSNNNRSPNRSKSPNYKSNLVPPPDLQSTVEPPLETTDTMINFIQNVQIGTSPLSSTTLI